MAECVCDARDERRLRPHDDEVDPEEPGEAEEALPVIGRDGVAGRERGDPGVARRRVELGQRGRRREPPGEGVLAAAGPDDEDAH
jgi:hypothetical protein